MTAHSIRTTAGKNGPSRSAAAGSGQMYLEEQRRNGSRSRKTPSSRAALPERSSATTAGSRISRSCFSISGMRQSRSIGAVSICPRRLRKRNIPGTVRGIRERCSRPIPTGSSSWGSPRQSPARCRFSSVRRCRLADGTGRTPIVPRRRIRSPSAASTASTGCGFRRRSGSL